MLINIDHLVIAVPDGQTAAAEYAVLLDRQPVLQRLESGMPQIGFQLDNVSLRLAASSLGQNEGIQAIVFGTADLATARHVLARRGIGTREMGAKTVALDESATHGVALSLVEHESPATPASEAAAALSGLDHIVIATANPERAAALYGARLGLEMKLDRSNAKWGSRLMFFKCGDLIVEVAHDLKKGLSDAPDRVWGLSWRAPDIAAAHARLSNAGVNVSEIRTGRKPGTRVFTVRDHTAMVPTLVIGATPNGL